MTGTDTERDLIALRLRNQRLAGSNLHTPESVVAWLGAVQSQDYAGARWALGLRANGLSDAEIERSFDAGTILRTHVLRPTWHLVVPADIHWLLALSRPRVHAANAPYYRKFELDDRLLARSRALLERMLDDGTPRTRSEISAALASARIVADGNRLAYLLMHAELEGVVCSGPRVGKQFTYQRLEQRAGRSASLPRDQALAELTRRYFTSHGPATIRDCAWWSGLTMRDISRGVEMIRREVGQREHDGLTYWFVESLVVTASRAERRLPLGAHLLPHYDEFLIAYKDRSLTRPSVARDTDRSTAADRFPHHVVVGGRLAGSWRRTHAARHVCLEVALYADDTEARAAVGAATGALGVFLGRPVSLSFADWSADDEDSSEEHERPGP